MPAEPVKPDEKNHGKSGWVVKLVALAVLLLAGGDLAGLGTFLPLGLDEAASTILGLWAIKTLTGRDLTAFLRRK